MRLRNCKCECPLKNRKWYLPQKVELCDALNKIGLPTLVHTNCLDIMGYSIISCDYYVS